MAVSKMKYAVIKMYDNKEEWEPLGDREISCISTVIVAVAAEARHQWPTRSIH
jgi:hypothetical protein